MRPMRLALIFDQEIGEGGGYQQALNATLLTRDLPPSLVETLYITTHETNIENLACHGLNFDFLRMSKIQKLRTRARMFLVESGLLSLVKRYEKYSPFEKFLIDRNVDLVYFLSPNSWARALEELNYITTVWDLCHRDDPEFPEVRRNRQLEWRDRNYNMILPRATAVFVDSELAQKNAVHRYGIDEDRVHVMPFQAAIATRDFPKANVRLEVNVHQKYRLDVPYVLYPAQFWAHKNHVYLLEGLKTLEQRHGLKIGAIFCGRDQGNLAYIHNYVRELGLEGRVRFIGFVENKEVPDLYCQSIALVMPTYFGPTNLPPLEAYELGVPVLYSDKAGLREQVGGAALLMDLNNPESMADHLKNLIEDGQLRSRLIEAGHDRIKYFNSIDRVGILRSVLEDFRWRRLCWR